MNYQVESRDGTPVAIGRANSTERRTGSAEEGADAPMATPVVRVKRVTPESLKYMDLFKYSMN